MLIAPHTISKSCPTKAGMPRGLSSVGRYEEAINYATAALAEAPDQMNKESVTKMIEKLKGKQDVN